MGTSELAPNGSVDSLEGISIKIEKYKCFGESPQGFDIIKPINILIGRNNSGKSSLLDLINYAVSPRASFLTSSKYKGMEPIVMLTKTLTESEIKQVFSENTSNNILGNFWQYGKNFLGKKITVAINDNRTVQFLDIEPGADIKNTEKYFIDLSRKIINPFSSFVFKKLKAERDINPEPADNNLNFQENGEGATNILERFINFSGLPSELVEKKLLDELNKIIEPDSSFKRIIAQQNDSSNWEIYLEEVQKGRVPLSESGSGLKTILLVLIYILLIPYNEKKPLSNYVFAFEELENNLHPALQRRLFLYLREIALSERAHFFITTHSSVVIDLFSNDNIAQIYHIIHNGVEATSTPVTTYMQKTGILDDLEIRASDLLQSNGIIWVEGPSDRLYINKWIELWSGGKFREGAHYQCIFYGGRLLAHLSGDIPEADQSKLIKILSINRNVIMLIDSDKKSESDDVSATKKRLCKEIEEINGFCWITAGKEVENYIPKSAISNLYKLESINDLEKFELFWDYLDRIKPGEGERFSDKKVVFAERIRDYLDKENLSTTLDMESNMAEMISRIKNWNNID